MLTVLDDATGLDIGWRHYHVAWFLPHVNGQVSLHGDKEARD